MSDIAMLTAPTTRATRNAIREGARPLRAVSVSGIRTLCDASVQACETPTSYCEGARPLRAVSVSGRRTNATWQSVIDVSVLIVTSALETTLERYARCTVDEGRAIATHSHDDVAHASFERRARSSSTVASALDAMGGGVP